MNSSLVGAMLLDLADKTEGYSAYVPYNPNVLFQALGILRANLGSAITIAFWIFIMITGVHLVVSVISAIGR